MKKENRFAWAEKIISFPIVFFILPIILGFLMYTHVSTLFEGDLTQHRGSIEVSYIQMAKFITSSVPRMVWQPQWYLGYPLSIIYTPLVPYTEAFGKWILGWEFGHTYRVLTAISYIGASISLFWFGRVLFQNTIAGFVSSLSYSLLPSILSYLYVDIAGDRFGAQITEPRRFTILVRWGEGPHIVSLLFIPLGALFLVNFLRTGKKKHLILGAIFAGLVALTNSIGAWGLAMLAFAIVIGEICESFKQWQTVVWRAIAFAATSYGLIAFWFNPFFLSSFFREGSTAASFWRDQFPWGWLMLGAALAIFIFLSQKFLYRFKGATASILLFLIMFGLVNTYYASGSERIELVPQVLRLTTEVDIAAYLLVGMVIGVVGYGLLKIRKTAYIIGMSAVALCCLLFIPIARQLAQELPAAGKSARAMGVDIKKSAEYEVATKLGEKVTGSERVLVPGNYSFYLNYFSDIPQLRGALFQSAIHPWAEHIYFQMVNGKQADISLAWLKIANIGWLVYSGPREPYHDYKVGADKFDEMLTLDEESMGDRYYKVPLTNASPAKAVSVDILKVKKPENAIDRAPIIEYADLLDSQARTFTISEKENGRYELVGETVDGEVVLVQMTNVPNWRARDEKGRRLEVRKDVMGFIVIRPKEFGPQKITLTYSKPSSVWLGMFITVATIAALGFFSFKRDSLFKIVEPEKTKHAGVEEAPIT